MTRTHTTFFSDQSLDDARSALNELRADWEHREPFIDAETARAGRDRLTAVDLALDRLRDRVD